MRNKIAVCELAMSQTKKHEQPSDECKGMSGHALSFSKRHCSDHTLMSFLVSDASSSDSGTVYASASKIFCR
jgi:hypothetical protein